MYSSRITSSTNNGGSTHTIPDLYMSIHEHDLSDEYQRAKCWSIRVQAVSRYCAMKQPVRFLLYGTLHMPIQPRA